MSHLQGWLADWVTEGLERQERRQISLASELGISQKHLSQLLLGRAAGSLDLWDRMLDATGVKEDALQ